MDSTCGTIHATVIDHARVGDESRGDAQLPVRRLAHDQEPTWAQQRGCDVDDLGQGSERSGGDDVELTGLEANERLDVGRDDTHPITGVETADTKAQQVCSFVTTFHQRDGEIRSSRHDRQPRQTASRANVDQSTTTHVGGQRDDEQVSMGNRVVDRHPTDAAASLDLGQDSMQLE